MTQANDATNKQKHFSQQEIKKWMAEQPKKPISAKVAIWDDRGRLLVVKTTYKPGWFLVGGMVGQNESPLKAALREAKEEVGANLTPEQLTFLGVRYGLSKERQDDYLHILFSCRLTEAQAKGLTLHDDELEAIRWVSLDETNLEILDHTYRLLSRARQKAGVALYDDQDEIYVAPE